MCISDLCIYVFVNREGYLMSERDDNSFAKLFFPLLTLSPAYFLLFCLIPQLYFVSFESKQTRKHAITYIEEMVEIKRCEFFVFVLDFTN